MRSSASKILVTIEGPVALQRIPISNTTCTFSEGNEVRLVGRLDKIAAALVVRAPATANRAADHGARKPRRRTRSHDWRGFAIPRRPTRGYRPRPRIAYHTDGHLPSWQGVSPTRQSHCGTVGGGTATGIWKT